MDSTLTIDSLSLTSRENEIGGMDVPEMLNNVIEINDKPASLEEFPSYWIEMYLPSLYQTSVSMLVPVLKALKFLLTPWQIEPEIIAGRLQIWVNYLEHSVKILVSPYVYTRTSTMFIRHILITKS
jgi:hypothetical protein